MSSNSNQGVFTDKDVIDVNQKLLDAIALRDFDTYQNLTAKDVTAIEPESKGYPVHGINFHKYYFDLFSHPHMTSKTNEQPIIPVVITMSNPHVRWLGGGCCSDGCGEGSAAIITYVRLDQTMTAGNDGPSTKTMSETRVWENRDGNLINVHFHKSRWVMSINKLATEMLKLSRYSRGPFIQRQIFHWFPCVMGACRVLIVGRCSSLTEAASHIMNAGTYRAVLRPTYCKVQKHSFL